MTYDKTLLKNYINIYSILVPLYPVQYSTVLYSTVYSIYIRYRGVTFLDCTRQVYNLGNGGVPVHHDPVDGICTNHEK